MPIIKSAKKKLRADRKRSKQNAKFSKSIELSIKKVKKVKSEKDFKKAISILDKAVKKNIIHKNKAARLKSKLSNFLRFDKN